VPASGQEGRMQRWCDLERRIGLALEGDAAQLKEWTESGESENSIHAMMEDWLAKSDPAEKGDKHIILNRMHVMGCVLARYAQFVFEEDGRRVQDLLPDCEEAKICETSIDSMSWRELKHTCDNIQICWTRISAKEGVVGLCWKLFSRLGFYLSHAFPNGAKDDHATNPINDVDSKCPHGDGYFRLTDIAIMGAVDLFFSLFRYVYVERMALPVPDRKRHLLRDPVQIHHHHLEAATDTFYQATMHDDVKVGALLQYMHRFSGMFHSISQVVYYHDPGYRRRKAAGSLEELRAAASQMDWIPVLQQIYPELELYHESVNFRDLPRDRWFWYHAPGKVWLVAPRLRFLWDPSPLVMIGHYVAETTAAKISDKTVERATEKTAEKTQDDEEDQNVPL